MSINDQIQNYLVISNLIKNKPRSNNDQIMELEQRLDKLNRKYEELNAKYENVVTILKKLSQLITTQS